MRFTNFQEAEPEIPLLVVGFDFRMASSAMREKLVTNCENRQYLYQAIQGTDDSAGFLVLETCNRLEWIVSTRNPEWIADILEAWMLDTWQRAFPGMTDFPSPYSYTCRDAVIHVLRVVVGMESLASGEAQIAGQFQSALKRAQKEKTTSPIINRLGHIAGRIAKTGFKIGFRSNYRQGIHGLSVKYLTKIFNGNLDNKNILVAGMGDIGRRTAALLEENTRCKVQRLNRTVKEAHQGKWLPLTQLPDLFEEADALVIATGAPVPIFDSRLLGLKKGLEQQEAIEKKLLLLDIGIPRQVGEALQQHPTINYRNIDDLLDLSVDMNKCPDMGLLDQEIQNEFLQFKRFCQGREMSDLLAGIHSGRLELTENRIPGFVNSQLTDLDENQRKGIEKAMKQFIRDYSNQLFTAFHDTMEKYWSSNGHTESNI